MIAHEEILESQDELLSHVHDVFLQKFRGHDSLDSVYLYLRWVGLERRITEDALREDSRFQEIEQFYQYYNHQRETEIVGRLVSAQTT